MANDNPFAFQSSPQDIPLGAEVATVTTRTLEAASLMRPWISFFSVLLWIGVVLFALGFVGLIFGILLGGMGFEGVIMIVAYGLLAVFYVYFARKLGACSRNLRNLGDTGQVVYLEDALFAMKDFWRIAGIMTILFICLYVVALVLMVGGIMFMGNAFGP